MKRFLLVALLLGVGLVTTAQIVYNPGGGGGGGFTTPGTGIIADAGGGSLAARTITGGDGISMTNGDGSGGNPTIAVNSSVGRKGSGAAAPPEVCANGGDTYQLGDTYVDTTTNSVYVCEGTDDFVPVRGRGSWFFEEEFYGGSNSSGSTAGQGMFTAAIGGGAATLSFGAGATNSPGILELSTGTSGNGSTVAISNGGGGGLTFATGTVTGKTWRFTALIIPGSTAATAIDSQAIWVGLGATTNVLAQTGFIGVMRDTSRSHAAWVFAMCDSSTTGCQSAGDDTNQDTVVSTITPTTGNIYRFDMWHKNVGVGGASTYYFSINGETAKTFCASGCDKTLAQLPAVSLGYMFAHETLTGSVRRTAFDWIRGYVNGLTR